jgi:cytochrome c
MSKSIISAALFASLAIGIAHADDATDLKRGKLLFIQCRACHDLQPDPAQKVGPNLNGIIGRKSASVEDFAYSPALTKASLVFDKATLDRWIEKPSALVPGNAMAFAGVASAEDRAALIKYIEKESAKR